MLVYLHFWLALLLRNPSFTEDQKKREKNQEKKRHLFGHQFEPIILYEIMMP